MLEPSLILHPSIGSNMVGNGDRHLMRNSHENQDPSTNVTSHSSSGMIQSVHMSSSFVILFWLLDSKHFGQAIDIPFSNFRSCQQEANYMLALENCKEGDSVIPMQVLVQVELLTIRTRASTSTKCDSNAVPSLSAPPSLSWSQFCGRRNWMTKSNQLSKVHPVLWNNQTTCNWTICQVHKLLRCNDV